MLSSRGGGWSSRSRFVSLSKKPSAQNKRSSVKAPSKVYANNKRSVTLPTAKVATPSSAPVPPSSPKTATPLQVSYTYQGKTYKAPTLAKAQKLAWNTAKAGREASKPVSFTYQGKTYRAPTLAQAQRTAWNTAKNVWETAHKAEAAKKSLASNLKPPATKPVPRAPIRRVGEPMVSKGLSTSQKKEAAARHSAEAARKRGIGVAQRSGNQAAITRAQQVAAAGRNREQTAASTLQRSRMAANLKAGKTITQGGSSIGPANRAAQRQRLSKNLADNTSITDKTTPTKPPKTTPRIPVSPRNNGPRRPSGPRGGPTTPPSTPVTPVTPTRPPVTPTRPPTTPTRPPPTTTTPSNPINVSNFNTLSGGGSFGRFNRRRLSRGPRSGLSMTPEMLAATARQRIVNYH